MIHKFKISKTHRIYVHETTAIKFHKDWLNHNNDMEYKVVKLNYL